jgi:NAD-dependent SIR2 family protein deacetylase
LVVFTGAGGSAESGIPNFRDAQTALGSVLNQRLE